MKKNISLILKIAAILVVAVSTCYSDVVHAKTNDDVTFIKLNGEVNPPRAFNSKSSQPVWVINFQIWSLENHELVDAGDFKAGLDGKFSLQMPNPQILNESFRVIINVPASWGYHDGDIVMDVSHKENPINEIKLPLVKIMPIRK